MNTLEETATALGFTIEAGTPTPHNTPEWKAIAFPVTLSRNGKPVFSTIYKMGVGHFEKQTLRYIHEQFTPVKNTIRKHGVSVVSVLRQADQAEALGIIAAAAERYEVKPQLADVIASLLLDGSPDFDALSFEDWSADYGYDTDSRIALETYTDCVKTGQAIRRAVTPAELETLREAAAEY
jgi:hypothetical protein